MSETEHKINTRGLSRAEANRLKSLYNYINASNKAFAKMTADQKRVQVASDILLQLRMKRMRGQSVYFENDKIEEKISRLETQEPKMEVRDVFKTMPTCDVCGIGSAFVAVIDRMDKLKLRDLTAGASNGVDDRHTMTSYLTKMKVFSILQLDLIEHAFEDIPGFCPMGESGNKRLTRIWKRVIETKGKIDENTFPARFGWYGMLRQQQ